MTKQKQIFTFETDLKQLATIILALIILLQQFNKVGVVLSFKINQNNIAKTLCVKKKIKNNTCQGKCHLKKQLDKVNEEEQKQSPNNQKEQVEVLYCFHHNQFNFLKKTVSRENKNLNIYTSGFYASSFITDIFQPPELNLI